MIRINLLPFRAARKRENVKRQIIIYAASVCCALLIMGGLFFKFSKDLSDLKEEEGRLNNELVSYQKELEKGKTGPVLLLSDIADAVPKNKLWLTSLSEKNGNLSLNGTAMDYETVSLFMNNLENTEQIIAAPVLKSTTRRELPEFKLTVSDFVLECKTYAAAKNSEQEDTQNKKKR